MRARALFVSLIASIVVIGMLAVPLANAAQPSKAQWRYILYLDADNSLDVSTGPPHEPVVESDFNELMSVGSTKDVAMFVFADRADGPANLFKVNKGSMTELTGFSLDGKEANMGDPATLRALVTYVFKVQPAEKTLLMFWDHGSPRIVASDDHPSDDLTHVEVIQALRGFHIDVMGADECNVAQVDVAYEYRAGGLDLQYLLASETFTGWRGYPYDATLARMVANPQMTPRELAVMFVEEVDKLLSQNPYMGEEVNSHAAIDMSQVDALVSSLMDLTNLLSADMKANAGLVSKARGGACFSYGTNAINVIDLKTFVQLIGANSASKAVKDQCAKVIAIFDQTVIALQATQTVDHQLFGLGIVFPNHSWEVSSYYWSYAIVGAGWGDFLYAYWAVAGSV
jgi:hypothetical protein